MDRIDDTGDDEARLADASLGHFRGDVARAVQLDAVEAKLLEELKLLEQRAPDPDHADFHGLFEFAVGRLSSAAFRRAAATQVPTSAAAEAIKSSRRFIDIDRSLVFHVSARQSSHCLQYTDATPPVPHSLSPIP
jgi:hypothetical protein